MKSEPRLTASEITSETIFLRRRELLLGSLFSMATPSFAADSLSVEPAPPYTPNPRWDPAGEKSTPASKVTSYNNFYEFGPDKDSPLRNAQRLKVRPWTLSIEGEVDKPGLFGIDEILAWGKLEERIYRMRCVEGWSAVIPWIGLPLAELIKRVAPRSSARFVEFESLADPEQMPYTRIPLLDWPYREALRMDEAAHPLTLLAVGMYGQLLPKQNGAPLRLVVPWKYGFKGAKSIVRIRFVEQQPLTSWIRASPREYGFYANVNPLVSHPRWSQSHERRLGDFFKRPTLPFNGYAEQVAQLYTGMDLQRNF